MMRAGLKSFASRRSFATVRDKLNELGSQMPQGGPPTGLVSAVAGISAVGFLGYNSVFTVQGGQRAVLWSRISGVKDASLTGSKDLQMVNITLRVLSKPNTSELAWIYKRLGHDYDDRVLPSIVNEVTKAVVACYNASELLTKREQVSNEIRHRLVVRAADFRIILDDVSITHLSFSHEYTAAVEAKQVAQQDSERARYIVEKAIQEKKSIIVKAEGEAQSAPHRQGHPEQPGFVKLRKIDTARRSRARWPAARARSTSTPTRSHRILGNEQLGEDTSAKKRGWFR
ncbi:hypothetical protein JL721_6479 [Aureococcus anophagefferens]|nr:hypothetical protein JL721_6479 [Aureococcus anophagefferens]